jgi:hypothetical protein
MESYSILHLEKSSPDQISVGGPWDYLLGWSLPEIWGLLAPNDGDQDCVLGWFPPGSLTILT